MFAILLFQIAGHPSYNQIQYEHKSHYWLIVLTKGLYLSV